MFAFILALVAIYFMISLRLIKRNTKIINKRKLEILRVFDNLMEETSDSIDKDLLFLKKQFKTTNGFKAFHRAYQTYSEANELSSNFRELLHSVVDYQAIFNNRNLKLTYRKSYVLFLMSELHLDFPEVREFALKYLSDPSIYVRVNALKVICTQTEVTTVMRALDKINDFRSLFNKRAVIDFLDDFRGDVDALDRAIIEKFDQYGSALKYLLLEHIINMKNGDEAVRLKALYDLKNSDDNELIIKSTRYFSVIPDERAKENILENLSHMDWKIRAIAAKALLFYADDEVVFELKKALSDLNFFVRKNSAQSLFSIIGKQEIFDEAIENRDPFERDVLNYMIANTKLSGYDEYKKILSLEAGKSELDALLAEGEL